MRALSGNRSKKSTDELRQKIDKILRESKKRVVVIIDDIDRLDSEEIHQIFKLAKNAGRFSNVSYLLAFDQKVVAKVLAERYPEETESLQRKLIQITTEDKSFTVDAAYLLKLSRNAGKLFESSKAPLKNKLLKIILSNLEFDDKILFYKRRAPFDVISECSQTQSWLRQLDSNQDSSIININSHF